MGVNLPLTLTEDQNRPLNRVQMRFGAVQHESFRRNVLQHAARLKNLHMTRELVRSCRPNGT